MEKRHGQVAHVVVGEREHLGDDGPDAGEAPLAAQAGLGCAGGSRGEEQEAEGVLGHSHRGLVGERASGDGRQECAVCGGGVDVARCVIDHQDPLGRQGRAEVVAFDQFPVGRIGDQELALGVGQVAGEVVTPVGGVAPVYDGAGKCGTAHPEDVLGDVVHE